MTTLAISAPQPNAGTITCTGFDEDIQLAGRLGDPRQEQSSDHLISAGGLPKPQHPIAPAGLLDLQAWPTLAMARRVDVEYISWYNGTRHSTLGYKTPAEYEASHHNVIMKVA